MIPEHCVGQFFYKFDRIGSVRENDVCKEATAVYFETLAKGFDYDIALDPPRDPRPLSGLSLILTEGNEIPKQERSF